MFYACIGAPGQGKSFLLKNYLLPTLALNPTELTPLAPSENWPGLILVADPRRPTTGQQYPEHRHYTDVSEWRRASDWPLVCCFDRPSYDEMMQLAWDLATDEKKPCWTILVFDELARVFPKGAPYQEGELRKLICEEGRHYGIAVMGCAMRLGDINLDARKVLQGVWISDLSEEADRKAAAEMFRNKKLLDTLQLKPREFLEWNRSIGSLDLITIVSGRRIVVTSNLNGDSPCGEPP